MPAAVPAPAAVSAHVAGPCRRPLPVPLPALAAVSARVAGPCRRPLPAAAGAGAASKIEVAARSNRKECDHVGFPITLITTFEK